MKTTPAPDFIATVVLLALVVFAIWRVYLLVLPLVQAAGG